MALCSLVQAKQHLRVFSDAEDNDIMLKLVQAEAIVLDYLKRRSGRTAFIVSSSAANPSVITTDPAHDFANAETVTIAGHVDSEPSINGSHVVSSVTATTFTIPVAVSEAGTGGTATIAWTEANVPGHVQAAVLIALTHLHENRGDDMEADANLWEALGRLLSRSRDPALA